MRNRDFERDVLTQAVERAGLVPSSAEAFIHAVFERLQKGGEEYGDSAFDRRGSELLREIQEEAADVAGWSLMRLQSPDDLAEDDAHLLRNFLVEAISKAIQLWQLLEGAQELEREAPRKPQPHSKPFSLCDTFKADAYKDVRVV